VFEKLIHNNGKIIMATRHIFIFVNSTSGSNRAKSLLSPQVSEIVMMCPTPVHIYFYNSKTNVLEQHAGFIRLKQLVEEVKNLHKTQTNNGNFDEQKENNIFAIAAGGDGTVMHVVNQLFVYNIDFLYVTIGVLPYGTGICIFYFVFI
jgi:hypothetical protein